MPFAAAHVLEDKANQARCVAAMEAFNAPYSMMLLELDSAGMYDTAAEAMGKVFVSTELGGGGSASARTAGIAKRGVANVLKHAGILAGSPEPAETVRLDMPDGDCYVNSETAGLIEYCVDLGDEVRAGDLVARIHDVERTGGNPVDYRVKRDGLFIGRHFPGLIALGDPIAVVDRPGTGLEFRLEVDSASGQVEALYAIDGGAFTSLGTLFAQGAVLQAIQQTGVPLMVGLIGTSNTLGAEVEGGRSAGLRW